MHEHSANSTRPSLLVRVKDSTDTKAWQEFFDLYSPLIYSYARQRGLNHDDAEEISSSVYETIIQRIANFEYSSENSGFRAWLRTIVTRRVIDFYRKKKPDSANSGVLQNLVDGQAPHDESWDHNWRLHHLKYCVAQVGKRVQPSTFQAFQMLTEQDLSVEEVCLRLAMNPNQVHKIKSRFLELVRKEMEQFDFKS